MYLIQILRNYSTYLYLYYNKVVNKFAVTLTSVYTVQRKGKCSNNLN